LSFFTACSVRKIIPTLPFIEGSQAALNKPQAVPGVIVAIQTFGDLVNLGPRGQVLQ